MAETLLELKGVRAGYGEAVVLDAIALSLPAGGSLAVLGRNGVGKTTLLLTVMGIVRLMRGSIHFDGADISHVPAHKRAHLGLGWVPQERDVFPSLTVEENLTVAARRGRWDLPAVYALFPRLRERRRNMGNQLSGGEQQMLTIARTLMTNPSVLLLDEPLEGLAPIIVEELTAAIRHMSRDEGIALVLVEQHAEMALGLTEEAIIIERGQIAHRAPSAKLLDDRAALDRYVALQLDDMHGHNGRDHPH
ncbi:ABC transporter ATP-binding protein [Mesorhizobium xinjiangense]|uniref:ABC transporter ATP-binding protein n=1 Tax=Mesorhizobium xinjiangense TaxID=2678685 RepID=UPI0012EDDAD5|nr:ABC transporter ATP-binding protein [Mesorhizobium xinjiangense]